MIPTTWSEGNIVKLPKKKKISQTVTTGKVFLNFLYQARNSVNEIVNRIKTEVDSKLRKEQADF